MTRQDEVTSNNEINGKKKDFHLSIVRYKSLVEES